MALLACTKASGFSGQRQVAGPGPRKVGSKRKLSEGTGPRGDRPPPNPEATDVAPSGAGQHKRPVEGHTSLLNARRERGRQKLLQRLKDLLQGLDRAQRLDVLTNRFSEAQRAELERWMVTSAKSKTQPISKSRSKRPAPSQGGSRKRAPPLSAAHSHKAEERFCWQAVEDDFPPPQRGLSARVWKSLCTGAERPPGLVIHARRNSDECWFSTVVTVGGLRLLTKETRSLNEALKHHACLAVLKGQITDGDPATFELSFRWAVTDGLREHGFEAEALGLRFCVCLAVLWLPRPLVTPPFKATGASLDAGLRAWRLLGEARGAANRRGTVLQVQTPAEICAAWLRIRAAYMEAVATFGPGQTEVAAARVASMETAQLQRRELMLERWNRRQMAAEELRQRRAAAADRRALQREQETMLAEDAQSKHLRKYQVRSDRPRAHSSTWSDKACRSIKAIDLLLLRWQRLEKRYLVQRPDKLKPTAAQRSSARAGFKTGRA